MECLIRNGAIINLKNKADWTPLHFAANNGHQNVVEFLINNRADLNAMTSSNKTALQMASEMLHTKIVISLALANSYANEDPNSDENMFNTNDSCFICVQPRNGIYAFLPCGHSVACQNCCQKLFEEKRGCPTCRGQVTNYQKIFIQKSD